MLQVLLVKCVYMSLVLMLVCCWRVYMSLVMMMVWCEGYISPWSGYDDERWVCCAVQAEVVVWHQTQYSVTQHSSPHSHQPGQWWEWHIRARPIITKERTVWSNELGPAVSIEYNPSRITFEVRPISRVIWLWRGRMEDHGPDVFPIYPVCPLIRVFLSPPSWWWLYFYSQKLLLNLNETLSGVVCVVGWWSGGYCPYKCLGGG